MRGMERISTSPVEQPVQQEEHPCAYKDEQGHLYRRFLVDFGNQIRGGNVDRDASRQRQPSVHVMAEQGHGQDTRQR